MTKSVRDAIVAETLCEVAKALRDAGAVGPTDYWFRKVADRLTKQAETRVTSIMENGKHPSHKTRSSDASSFDEICINCGNTDDVLGGWGDLAKPCPMPDGPAKWDIPK